MQIQTVQLINISPEQLQSEITKGVKEHLDNFLKHFKPKEPNEYLSRRQVADMFGVDISSVSNWAKSGRIQPLGLGGRVYFLRSEVEASLKPLNV